ncbi:unnamed protein product [Ceutorhynchus assimilis]|uniref:H15 domain-containing protein n=1 Tax=Ceutorhynchus assimilis TaxID=467358 RepID=A0A9N9MUM4_9CUCU|nr:unnamed protein product [Ceutorhynchus assimilis]
MEEKPSTSGLATKTTTIRPKCTHPPVATMVNKAIEALNTKGGSSVKAIKKYMQVQYLVEADKLTPFIKKYLAKAVDNNVLIQAKGKGLTGSYKLVGERKKANATKVHVTASDVATNKAKSSLKTQKSTTNKPSATTIKQKPVGIGATKSKAPNLTKSSSSSQIKPKPVGKRASRDSLVLARNREQT